MAGYRDTLNLPRTEFPMKADLLEREPERLALVEGARRCYRQLRERRAPASRVWLLHDGPPYSNGHLHMGTAANKIWKDAAVRRPRCRAGTRPTCRAGTTTACRSRPSVAASSARRAITPDRLALRRRCREYAAHWVDVQRGEFERLGVLGRVGAPVPDHGHRLRGGDPRHLRRGWPRAASSSAACARSTGARPTAPRWPRPRSSTRTIPRPRSSCPSRCAATRRGAPARGTGVVRRRAGPRRRGPCRPTSA